MYRYLFLPFFFIPLIEVWILVKVGREIGAWSLIGLIILTAIFGVYFLRQQGLSTLIRAQELLSKGQLPATEMVEGAQLLVAGALLLTPGFATDTLGFLLLWPTTRRYFAKYLTRYAGNTLKQRSSFSQTYSSADEAIPKEPKRDPFGSFGQQAGRTGKQQDTTGNSTGNSNRRPESSQVIEGEFTRDE